MQRWVAVVFLKYFMSFEFCAEFNGNRCMRRVAIRMPKFHDLNSVCNGQVQI